MAVAALVISVLAILISGFSLWFARQQWQAKKIELARTDRARSAELDVVWTRRLGEVLMAIAESEVTTDLDIARVVNHGPAAATVVKMEWYTGQSWAQTGEWSSLAPGASVEFQAKVQASADRVRCTLSWSDGREERHMIQDVPQQGLS